MNFCNTFGLNPMPPGGIPDLHLEGFVLQLVLEDKTYGTIKTYLSMGPRVIQQEVLGPKTWIPIKLRPSVQFAMRAAQRQLGDASTPKLAITPDHLRGFFDALDFNNTDNIVIYTSYLVGFWAFLRKGNLVPGKASDYNDRQILRFKDITFDDTGRAWITLRSTKTIQFEERTVTLPLALLSGADINICPSAWLRKLINLSPGADPETPLFVLPYKGKGVRAQRVLHYTRFVSTLKRLLHRQGIDFKLYSGHSFRRGGATFAFNCGVAPEFIKMQGDWHSDCYQLYISSSVASQLTAVQLMAGGLHQQSCG